MRPSHPSAGTLNAESVVTMSNPDAKQTLSTLNSLIETLKDGELGYQQAAQEARDADLKTLCSGYSEQRHELAKVLQKAAYALGDAKPENSGSVTSTVHRGWIGLKAALTNQDRHAILAECERGEDIAKKAFADALAQGTLGPDLQAVVQEQHGMILAAHDAVKRLRDEAKAA